MTFICHGLGLLFAFLMLAPHGPVTYEQQVIITAGSSR